MAASLPAGLLPNDEEVIPLDRSAQKLFTPIQIGPLTLEHRVVMAPLTRSRSEQPGDIPGALMRQYYTQRASKGGFIISEATTISLSAKGWFGAPGIHTDEQLAGWRKITDAIHTNGASIFSQLWHTERASHIDTSGFTPVTSSVDPNYMRDETIRVSTSHGWAHPSEHRSLDISEIPRIIEDYRRAAERAKAAGFDGWNSMPVMATCPISFCRTE
jgi:N-ethylmaleimide reductase